MKEESVGGWAACRIGDSEYPAKDTLGHFKRFRICD
jgi:hypothetical protein